MGSLLGSLAEDKVVVYHNATVNLGGNGIKL